MRRPTARACSKATRTKAKTVKGKGRKRGPKPLRANLRRESVAIAKPASVLPNARVDASVVVSVLCSRFADHLPFYRQQGILRRHGVEISRATMSGWVRRVEESCKPLVDLIAKSGLESGYVQLDATPVKLLDPARPGAAREACTWAYRALDRPVFFEFAMGKSGETPKSRLEDYEGILQTDGASNFGGTTEKERVVHLLCWAHARRYFHKAFQAGEKQAEAYLDAIGRIYRLEKLFGIHKLDSSGKQKLRERIALPLPRKLFAQVKLWREKELLECLLQPGSRIDNNLVENAIRPLKLGLKNDLFIDHPNAGSCFACLYTLVEDCRLAGANPEEYLADLIERLLDHPISRLEEFVPQNWVKLRKSKNDDQ